jgi:hypothetical protein
VRFTQPWTKKKMRPGIGQMWERTALHEPRVIYLYAVEDYGNGTDRWMWIKVDGVGKDTGGMGTDALLDMYRRIA